VCEESDDLRSDLQAVTDVDVRDVSASDVEEAVDVVVDDVDELADAARDVAGAAMDDLQDAVDGLQSAVGDLDGDGSLEDRVRAVIEAGQGVLTAVGDLTDDAGC
jgi:hypothetical protein